MQSMIQERRFVWGSIGIIAFIAAVAPLLDTSTCNTLQGHASPHSKVVGGHEPSAAPRVGMHFAYTFIATLLFGVLLDPQGRYKRDNTTHIWVSRYGVAMGVACFNFIVVDPWIYALCPGRHSLVRMIFRTVLPILFYIPFLASTSITLYLMILRLRLAESQASTRATVLYRCLCGTFIIALVCFVLAVALGLQIVRLIGTVLILADIILLVAFTWTTARALWHSGLVAEEMDEEDAATAAWWLRLTAVSVVASTGTLLLLALVDSRPSSLYANYWANLIADITFAVDFGANAFCNLLCANLIGPVGGVEAAVHFIGRAKQIRAKLVEAARSKTANASALATMMEGKSADVLLNEAAARFRCISWDVLEQRPEIIVEATTLDGTSSQALFYGLTEPCEFAHCDVFLSHSWHDDSQEKWDALSKWCENFKLNHHRSPRLWLDKVCINQATIAADLQCLPIFLAACNGLLIISGPTYTFRLWCAVELFVYMQMFDDDETREIPTIITLSSHRETTIQRWDQFDAASCECFNPNDKVRMMNVVASVEGGIEGFNESVQWLASTLLERPQMLSADSFSSFLSQRSELRASRSTAASRTTSASRATEAGRATQVSRGTQASNVTAACRTTSASRATEANACELGEIGISCDDNGVVQKVIRESQLHLKGREEEGQIKNVGTAPLSKEASDRTQRLEGIKEYAL